MGNCSVTNQYDLFIIAVDYIRDLVEEKNSLKERARALQTALGEA
jgi:NADPH-dependent 7-cyano-7-deazaguanine reductase QueF